MIEGFSKSALKVKRLSDRFKRSVVFTAEFETPEAVMTFRVENLIVGDEKEPESVNLGRFYLGDVK
jgi:hypothetical protein